MSEQAADLKTISPVLPSSRPADIGGSEAGLTLTTRLAGAMILLVAAAVFAVIGWAILAEPASSIPASASSSPTPASLSVQQVGDSLMHQYVLPLEIVGLLLTAALIGAVVLAMDRGEGAE